PVGGPRVPPGAPSSLRRGHARAPPPRGLRASRGSASLDERAFCIAARSRSARVAREALRTLGRSGGMAERSRVLSRERTARAGSRVLPAGRRAAQGVRVPGAAPRSGGRGGSRGTSLDGARLDVPCRVLLREGGRVRRGGTALDGAGRGARR